MPIVPSPYDERIQNIRSRIKKQGDPRVRQKSRKRLEGLRGRQYFYQQRNRPTAPLPYSGTYETTVAGMEKTRGQQLADIAGRKLATQQQYGFEDQSNPFARAAMLQRQYQQQQARTLGSYARSGQLYAGAHARARESDRFGFERGMDEALREYQAELGELSREELGVEGAFETGIGKADIARLEEALQDRVTPEEAPPRPQAAQALLKRLAKRSRRLAGKDKGTKGKDDRRARELRERLRRMRDLPYG